MDLSSEHIKPLIDRFESYKTSNVGFFSEEEIESLRVYYMEHNLYEEALFILKYAIETYPFSFGFKIDKAEVFLMYGKEDQALRIIEEIEFIEPYNTEALFMKASILSQMGKHRDAVRYLKKCLTYEHEDVVDIYFHIGLEYQFLEDYVNANTYFTKVLNISPEHSEALFEISVSFDLSNRLEDGVAFFDAFINQNPYHAQAWFQLGYLYTRLALHEKALQAFDYACVTDESFIPAKINKANTLCILERYRDALDIYFEITEVQKPDSHLLYLIGETYENLSEFEKSLSYYKESTALDALNADAWLGIAVVKDLMDQTPEALLYAKKAVDIDPLNATYWFVKADLHRKMGDIEAAATSYEEVIELDPYFKDAWMDYSAMLFENESKDEAIELLNEAIFFLPEESEIYYRLTAYYIGSGLSEDASDALADALRLNQEGYVKMMEDMPQLKKSKFIKELLKIHHIYLQ